MKNNLGVLFPIASLPSKYGIGDFGKSSYKLLEWLKAKNVKYWQVLPLNPVGPGNSPYMSTCSFALETRYIDLEQLVKQGLLSKVPAHKPNAVKVDYNDSLSFKEKYLRKAYLKFKKHPLRGYKKFKKDNPWLNMFALFVTLRKEMNYVTWNKWPKEILDLFTKKRVLEEYSDEVEFQIFCQFIAFKQWAKIRRFAHKLGIQIIADCPFYVGIDSLDCLLNKEQFIMNEHYEPTLVSGCPPDAFSDDGQLWGTPIYDFEKMKADHYSFLIERLAAYMKTCDLLRLDHFRAFDTYCVIPAEDENAKRGEWKIGPRYDFFDELYRRYPDIKLIAEDLGDLFPSVLELRDHYNLPGMYIVEFTIFDVKAYPTTRQIVYPGTHDNQTLFGWFKSLEPKNKEFLINKFGGEENLYNKIFDYIYNLPSLMTIFQLQDLMKLDDEGRINYPGTIGDQNWSFKLKDFKQILDIRFENK